MELSRKQWFEDTLNAKLDLMDKYNKKVNEAYLSGNSKELHSSKYFVEMIMYQTNIIFKQYKKELGE